MVYFENFEEFQAASREVFGRSPCRTRYCCKYKSPKDGRPEVTLKVTDDVSCLKFRTTHSSDIKYIDQFSQLVAIWATVDTIHGEWSLAPDLITAQKKLASDAATLCSHNVTERVNRTKSRKTKKKREQA